MNHPSIQAFLKPPSIDPPDLCERGLNCLLDTPKHSRLQVLKTSRFHPPDLCKPGPANPRSPSLISGACKRALARCAGLAPQICRRLPVVSSTDHMHEQPVGKACLTHQISFQKPSERKKMSVQPNDLSWTASATHPKHSIARLGMMLKLSKHGK